MTSHSSHSHHGHLGSTKEVLYFIFCIILGVLVLAAWGVYWRFWVVFLFGLAGLTGAVLGSIAIWIKHRVLFWLTFFFLIVACCLAVFAIFISVVYTFSGVWFFDIWFGTLIFYGVFITLSIFVLIWTWQIRGGMKW